tara:strand:- start:233 stop:487 length:255 start_codon:yes stop_codon:yes gene_type:complete
MAWELWQNDISYDDPKYEGLYQIGFFCNTADMSFGPVLGIQVDTSKYKDARDQIYEEWKADDPRTLDSDEIYDEVKRIENIKKE